MKTGCRAMKKFFKVFKRKGSQGEQPQTNSPRADAAADSHTVSDQPEPDCTGLRGPPDSEEPGLMPSAAHFMPANGKQPLGGGLEGSAAGHGDQASVIGHGQARRPPPRKWSSLQRFSQTFGRMSMPLPIPGGMVRRREAPKL